MSASRKAVTKALKQKGFRVEQGKRDHDFYFLEVDGLVRSVYTKVSRGSNYKEIGDPLLKRMSKQLHLKGSEFEEFVACPLTRERYVEILGDRGIAKK